MTAITSSSTTKVSISELETACSLTQLTQAADSHATHHLYAIYTLGATPEVLQAAYETHKEYQRPAFDAPGEITEKNWKDHLGDEKYVVILTSLCDSSRESLATTVHM